MYVNPVLVGSAVTLLVEMAIVIVAVLWVSTRSGR